MLRLYVANGLMRCVQGSIDVFFAMGNRDVPDAELSVKKDATSKHGFAEARVKAKASTAHGVTIVYDRTIFEPEL